MPKVRTRRRTMKRKFRGGSRVDPVINKDDIKKQHERRQERHTVPLSRRIGTRFNTNEMNETNQMSIATESHPDKSARLSHLSTQHPPQDPPLPNISISEMDLGQKLKERVAARAKAASLTHAGGKRRTKRRSRARRSKVGGKRSRARRTKSKRSKSTRRR